MKISDVQNLLEKYKQQHGDIDVWTERCTDLFTLPLVANCFSFTEQKAEMPEEKDITYITIWA